ncbi:MAG TPA: hypothetical protein VLG72_00190 [Nitrospirota bacterium]|nr:hypothetical protein [Nitrospirota bacterium]
MSDKTREEFYLTKLQQVLPNIGGVQIRCSESPDFVFDQSGQIKGLEITVFHLPAEQGKKSHQETVSLRRCVVNRAEELHRARGGPALYLHAMFNSHLRLRKAMVPELAEKLAREVLESPTPASIEDGPYHISPSRLPPEFVRVWFHTSVDGKDKLWQPNVGGWEASIGTDHISAVIQEKDRLVSLYRESCEEVWLVIVHDLFSGAAHSKLTPEAAAAIYRHQFDRDIWLEPHIPSALELKNGT